MKTQPLTVVLWQLLLIPASLTLDVHNKPQIRTVSAFTNFDARFMDQWGSGGGSSWTIGNDSAHPFAGRQYGGGRRRDIRGSRRFGSGYPWDSDDSSTLSGRGFPFGVWPLWWGDNFMGTNEYNSTKDTIRPGGQLVTAIVQLNDTKYFTNSTRDETYYVLGDVQSVTYMMISLVTWCHTTPAWPKKFNPLAANATIRLENVIQYYRASSFALTSPLYNNTLARVRDANSQESTPLPNSIVTSEYRKCLDGVIANALPIMNKPPFNYGWKFNIAMIFGFLGIPILIGIVVVGYYTGYYIILAIAAIRDYAQSIILLNNIAAEKREIQRARALETFRYESYP